MRIFNKKLESKLEKNEYQSKEKMNLKIIKLICEENLVACFSWRFFSENSKLEIFEEVKNLNKTNIKWKKSENTVKINKDGFYKITVLGVSKLKNCLKGFRVRLEGSKKNLKTKILKENEEKSSKLKLIKKSEFWVIEDFYLNININSLLHLEIIESFSQKNLINGNLKIKKIF